MVLIHLLNCPNKGSVHFKYPSLLEENAKSGVPLFAAAYGQYEGLYFQLRTGFVSFLWSCVHLGTLGVFMHLSHSKLGHFP